ncbi:hypothetical protein TWF106_000846 [Orbilia oligospora]|uniref:Uncharacterized protein n=1 Tax=Orbilia oligospora TaxID=2813651 RepID=A0A6G1LSX6_ORBOL|nr:hypothetical protein TWF679_011200 [Orbilia oligospora]KAF3226351.1 hypothetical protein TWF106_000846 [Orbilia oligospora]KAF3228909.1 hypothetical protein TWF191_002024 [Orbilia oligospora]KAF3232913.1 hypothetical protein TWF192_002782 [Orbilia oligospora]
MRRSFYVQKDSQLPTWYVIIVRSYSNGMPKPLVSPTAEVIYRVEDKPPNQTWIGTLIQSVLMLRLITARLGYNLSLRIAE